ncbi:hypothetical protein DTL42_10800 [Bremerella cremea]|uniref:LITAF domain-containing protein n=1 Tax=Bremerella cremea TaxID=1031537 RepID=A0A368KS57_9BACT|nr:hypothetical protein [Bremerella cremea]RCS50587.1 hypothetical protein DTL42_10800 [Bremerella cremea]
MVSDNPFAEQINPFASPESTVQTRKEKSGEYVIVAKRIHGGKVITLPYLCIRCGEKVSEEKGIAYRMEKKLSWIHPATLLLILVAWPIFLLVALLVRKKCSVTYSICPECKARRRWLWLYFALLLVSVACLIMLAITFETPWPMLGVLGAVIGLAVVLSKINSVLLIAWYSKEIFQLKGAGPAFLERAQSVQSQEPYYTAVLAEDGRTA